jgi:ribosomal protein L11 methyltransferase
MIRTVGNFQKTADLSLCAMGKVPYNDLYIYYIKGALVTKKFQLNPDFIGNWIEDGFSFLFFHCDYQDGVDELVKEQNLSLIDTFQMTYNQWHGGELTPFTAGDFHVLPPWKVSTSDTNGKKTVLVDPGVVFGNGNHPTTQTCLEILSFAFKENQIKSSIDIGTGTGLLSIAAALAGSGRNLALDFNYLAARTAGFNIALNGLSREILPIQGKGEDYIDWACDLMIANIHYDVMKRLLLHKGFLNKNLFILSGLLRSQSLAIETMLGKLPVRIIEKTSPDGIWFTYYGKVGI